MAKVGQLSNGTRCVLGCGCHVLIWRRERERGRIVAFVKALSRCTRRGCILDSVDFSIAIKRRPAGFDGLERFAIHDMTVAVVDPLALALEETFGEN